MTRIIKWLLIFGLCFATGLLTLVLPFFFPTRSEEVLGTWEFRRGVHRVLVTAYAEENSFVPGTYYFFEYIDAVNNRREIMAFRHDDPVEIRSEQVRFINDRICYVYMGWMYAVTTDGGFSWSVWNAEKELPNWQCCNYRLIQSVHIEPDGSGVMNLNPTAGQKGEMPKLYTGDYGRHWTTE